MTEDWTISVRQLRALYALEARGDKGMPTGPRNTNAVLTYQSGEALEARGLARIAVEAGAYRIYVTPKGVELAARLRAAGRA